MRISAYTVACALGGNKGEVLANLEKGAAPGMVQLDGDIKGRAIRFGLVPGELPEIGDGEYDFRSCRLLRHALLSDGFMEAAKRLVAKYGAERVAVVLGDSTTGIDEAQNYIDEWLSSGVRPNELDYSMIELGTPADWLKRELGVKGPSFAISTACSSGAKAFASARRLVEAGFADAAIVGGVDSRCRFAMNGFNALGALSEGESRPFAPDRDGINLGEGVALFILEKGDGALRFAGAGETSDAYHPTAPDPSGRGAAEAMRLALEDAGLSADTIGYVNFHGTGTIANDDMEMKAFKEVFGLSDLMDGPAARGMVAESTKSLTGHCLGAAGAVEAAICLLRLESGKAKAAISNSFAFGGSNASAVFTFNGDVPDFKGAVPKAAEREGGSLPEIEELVPHRGRMSFLDKVERIDLEDESIVVSFSVSHEHVLWDGKGVPGWAAIEFMAQACAALSGAADMAKCPGSSPRPGFLLGTRVLDIGIEQFESGRVYTVTAKREFGDDTTSAFSCNISLDGSTVASATLTAFRPGDDFINENIENLG